MKRHAANPDIDAEWLSEPDPTDGDKRIPAQSLWTLCGIFLEREHVDDNLDEFHPDACKSCVRELRARQRGQGGL